MERGNDTTERLRALSCGEVTPVSGKASPPWDEARAPQCELALSILERWRTWHAEIEAAPSPSEALNRSRRRGRLRRARAGSWCWNRGRQASPNRGSSKQG